MMKKNLIIGLLNCCIFPMLFGQDVIVLKTADEIKSKVTEVTDITVKYRKWENLNGPIYNINKKEILFIRYENGTKEVFNASSNNLSNEAPKKERVVEIETIEEVEKPAKKIGNKKMVRCSWDIASLNVLGYEFTRLGPLDVGYSNRFDFGVRLYQEKNFEFGMQFNPINFSVNSVSSSYEYAVALEEELTNQSGVNWNIVGWERGGPFITAAASFGVYSVWHSKNISINLGINAGLIDFSDLEYGCDLRSFYGDELTFKSYVDLDNTSFLNPRISFILGNPKQKVRVALNLDYKYMWLITSLGDGWVMGIVDNNYVDERTPHSTFRNNETGIFNFGIGITGF